MTHQTHSGGRLPPIGVVTLRLRAWVGGPLRWFSVVESADGSPGDRCWHRHTSLDAANKCTLKRARNLNLPADIS